MTTNPGSPALHGGEEVTTSPRPAPIRDQRGQAPTTEMTVLNYYTVVAGVSIAAFVLNEWQGQPVPDDWLKWGFLAALLGPFVLGLAALPFLLAAGWRERRRDPKPGNASEWRLDSLLVSSFRDLGATELHIEPVEGGYRIRRRINGELIERHLGFAQREGEALVGLVHQLMSGSDEFTTEAGTFVATKFTDRGRPGLVIHLPIDRQGANRG